MRPVYTIQAPARDSSSPSSTAGSGIDEYRLSPGSGITVVTLVDSNGLPTASDIHVRVPNSNLPIQWIEGTVTGTSFAPEDLVFGLKNLDGVLLEDRVILKDWYTTNNRPALYTFTVEGTYRLDYGSDAEVYYEKVNLKLSHTTNLQDVMIGNESGDRFLASPDDDELYGYGGNDTLSGGNGDDSLYGGDGNDVLRDGPGDDVMVGGAGNDTLYAGEGNDILAGEQGDDVLVGEGGMTG